MTDKKEQLSSMRNRPKSRQSIAHLTPSSDLEHDKENVTTDLGSIRKRKVAVSDPDKRKLRSKSLGPGGLEALQESAGNTTKKSSEILIKSILKPTVPLTPPRAIPSFDDSRARSAKRSGRKSPKNGVGEELLIDFSTPAPSDVVPNVTRAGAIQDPFSPVDSPGKAANGVVALRAGEEQEVAASAKEKDESRRAEEQAMLEHQAARRKSMANRRVSFAPEATLHTWNVLEMAEDSTASSASNSTRRQSSITTAHTPDQPGKDLVPEPDQNEPPSTPSEPKGRPLVNASPVHQQDSPQQRRRRRSSEETTAPSDGGRGKESSPASTHTWSSTAGDSSPLHVEDSIHSSLDEDGDTAMNIDDATGQTVRSELSSSSTGSSLDGRLRRATVEAGTRGIDYDENGDDLSMELAEGTITNAFQPWVNGQSQAQVQSNSAMQDRENINPFSPAFKAEADAAAAQNGDTAGGDETQDMTMDMTVAAGAILSKSPSPKKSYRNSVATRQSFAEEPEFEKISLQEFLNMTNIHFIELSTTKRRHTLAPAAPAQLSREGSSATNGACLAAVATTLPLLELYQHATRELKAYISSGRKVIRSIEQKTLEEQPALFREYVDARPDVKMVMDNQFRNGKAHARLQSKEGWYAWRRQLVEGLRGGLNGIRDGMEEDSQSLARQETVLENCVPELVKHFGELEKEAQLLQQRAEDFESADHESLMHARAELDSTDHEVAQKMIDLGQAQQQASNKIEALAAADELKVEFQGQIAEAERMQNECRGWKADDVAALQQRVKVMEQRSGWELVTAEHEVEEGDVDLGPALTMRYRDALRLFFYPAAFENASTEQSRGRRARRSKSDSGPVAPISLTYAPVEGDRPTLARLPTPQRFFLQLLQGHLHALSVSPRGSASSKTLLTLVSGGWDLAVAICEEIRRLEMVGITHVSILGDEQLGAKCMLMLPSEGRIDVQFTLRVLGTDEGRISTSVTVEAGAKYGSVAALLTGPKASQVQEALDEQVSCRILGEGAWVAAVRGLASWVNIQKEKTNKDHKRAERQAPQPTTIQTPQKEKTNKAHNRAERQTSQPTTAQSPPPAPVVQKKMLKRPVPMEELMEEAAARQEEVRRQEEIRRHEDEKEAHKQEEEVLMSATKTPVTYGRRPGALRRSP